MPTYRVDRTEEDIKRELTDIVRGLKDPRIGNFVTIVRVDLAQDLSFAKVYVSTIGGMERTVECVKGLKSASGYIRREINQRLRLRRSPEFKFIADDSIEHSADILKLIHDIHEKEEK